MVEGGGEGRRRGGGGRGGEEAMIVEVCEVIVMPEEAGGAGAARLLGAGDEADGAASAGRGRGRPEDSIGDRGLMVWPCALGDRLAFVLPDSGVEGFGAEDFLNANFRLGASAARVV